MNLSILRFSFACFLVASVLVLEIGLIYEWQQKFKLHIVHMALALGAFLTPSLYLLLVAAYKCTRPLTSLSKWPPNRMTFFGFSLPKRIALLSHFLVGIILSLFGLFVVVVLMSTTSAWCCIRESRRVEMCDLAAAAAKVFNQNGLDYHVTFGTLLGHVRRQADDQDAAAEGRPLAEEAASKTRSLIPWEHDMDIAIAEKQAEIAYKLLKERGFTLERRPSESVVAFRIHLPGANIWLSAWAMTWIDVYPFVVEKHTGEIISKNSRNYMKRPLISDVRPYRNLSFCGFDSFSAPRLPLRHVKKQFGANWRKPEFPDNYRNNTCRLFMDC